MELTEGIILKTMKYQENSKVCYIITREGLVTALVRASLDYHSKNFSYSQELSKIKFAISKSKKNSFDIMTSGMLVDSYLNLKKDYDTLFLISKLMDLVYKSIDHVTNYQNLYDLFDFTLSNINDNKLSNRRNVVFYPIILKFKLLYLLGVGPKFSGCVVCDKKTHSAFSVERGGVVCRTHQKDNDYVSDYVDVMMVLYLGHLDKLTVSLIDSIPIESYSVIEDVLTKYYDRYLSIKI